MNRFLQIFKVKDLKKKILIVAGLLIAFRVLTAIPIPGIDANKLRSFFNSNQLLGFLNIFSGGGLSRLSIAMLGVGPYITATIIMQLLTIIFPKFKEMYYEEGSRGQAKFNQYSRLLTVPLAFLQAYGFLALLNHEGVVKSLSLGATLVNVLIITAGSMITMWLGELISEQKIGNGISLIIVAGIVSGIPTAIRSALISYSSSNLPTYVAFVFIAVLLTAAVVLLNEGERKVPIAYSRQVRGNKMYGGAQTYLPIKVNSAGMIPLIFAISVLLFPQFIAQISAVFSQSLSFKLNAIVSQFLNNTWIYGIIYFLLVFIFTYFYTSITFNPEEIARNLQRSGGFVLGIRPGQNTIDFFSNLVSRVTFFGAFFLGLIAVTPLVIGYFSG
ncbi:preprotein translocase subunit SecY, partial [Patescibacteria group bacterium]|nr:preprotein translocase subunit SecY [Patescibacteria group bacterium]